MEIGLLILRIVVGLLLVGHGAQLLGWFGGPGPGGTGRFFTSLGYPRGRRMAQVAGATEAGAGTLLVLGLATPLATAGIIGVMLNAAVAAHAENGLWNAAGGFELPLVYATVALALAFTGPGAVSFDAALGRYVAGWGPGMLAAAGGVCVGLAVLATRRAAPAAEKAPAKEAPAKEARQRQYADSRR